MRVFRFVFFIAPAAELQKNFDMRHSSIVLPFTVLICTAVLLLASGCGSTSKIQQPISTKLGQYKSAAVTVKANVILQQEGRLDDYMKRLQDEVVRRLRERKAFEKISVATNEPVDLQIVITITRISDVDSGRRFMMGMYAGPAVVRGYVEFREGAGGKRLGSAQVEGASGSGTFVGGTTHGALDQFGGEIVELVMKNL